MRRLLIAAAVFAYSFAIITIGAATWPVMQ
jgi:hypothetical protein